MEKKGKKLICDRCGEEIFLERLNDTLTYEGYIRFENYASKPEGWKTVYRSMSGTDMAHLCPTCAGIFEDVLKHFWEGDYLYE